MKKTALEWFDRIIEPCKTTAREKAAEYGSSWTWYRSLSLIDRLFSKAKRIRTIQETQENKVGESIEDEFRAILNYSILYLVHASRDFRPEQMKLDDFIGLYNEKIVECKKLMEKKNHDYGEAWRDMSQIGITDEIIVKLVRSKQMNAEGNIPFDNIKDLVNYAIFALIQIEEQRQDSVSETETI
jgi:hypothetical protein